MSVGHGRGYFGEQQLDRAPKRPSRLWWKVAAVAGLGAFVWFMLPRKQQPVLPQPSPPPPTPPPSSFELEQLARLRGFSSAKAYEEAVLGSIRELEAAGAKISTAPHLQNLSTRTEP